MLDVFVRPLHLLRAGSRHIAVDRALEHVIGETPAQGSRTRLWRVGFVR